jgi:hypothetical protein
MDVSAKSRFEGFDILGQPASLAPHPIMFHGFRGLFTLFLAAAGATRMA